MRFVPVALAVTLLAGCTPAETPEAAEEMPAGPTMAEFAGTWQMSSMLQGQSDPVMTTISGSATGTDWTMTAEGRDPIPMQAQVVGDSLVLVSAEYESLLRPGVMVTVRTAGVLQNGTFAGNLEATYRLPSGSEVVTGTIAGTRVP